MAIPPWTVELLRRGLSDVAKKAGEPETLRKLKSQATELLNELPESAARSLDRVIRSAESGKESVRRWTRKHTTLAVPMLNATGQLMQDVGTGVAVSDDAIAAAVDSLRGDSIGGDAMATRLARRFAHVLPAGDHALAITSNFPAALAALGLLADSRSLVIHRSHAVRMPGGQPLPEAIDGMLPLVSEVGAIDSIQPEDFAGLDPFWLLQADTGNTPIAPLNLEVVWTQDVSQIAILPLATWTPLNLDSLSAPVPSAHAALAAGFDLVVLPGDGLVGGTSCGIIVGKREHVEAITANPSWNSLTASDAVHAMMLVVLESSATVSDSIPITALLHTSEENIRGRAERLALRLSASESIAACHITAEPAMLTEAGRWQLPSRQVRVRHASLEASAWSEKLREDVPSLWTKAIGDELVIDLRWISPSDDAKIGQLLAGDIPTT